MVKNFSSLIFGILLTLLVFSYCQDTEEVEITSNPDLFMKRSMAIGRMGFRPGKRSYLDYIIKEDMDPEFDDFHNFNYAIKKSAALGRLNFRPAKKSLALGRSGFRPGKRSIALGRQKFRPGKRTPLDVETTFDY
uniref:Short neuropeptide F n=1 Tax=Parastrongyloides trichosuri TaxID=131310 RepID=A0A0N4Z0J1_PARTI